MTSNHQPADMGMIASLKVGYRTKMLEKLLAIFDEEGGYERAAEARKMIKAGCRGLDYGGKAHLLDASTILFELWSKDGKYAKEDGIKRCWSRAGIYQHQGNATSTTMSRGLPYQQKIIHWMQRHVRNCAI